MTDTELSNHIAMAFIALYGKTLSRLDVQGLGTDTLTVEVDFREQPTRVFVAEVDSDDDGYLRFVLEDTTVTVLVPYGEADDTYEATSYSGGDQY